MVSSLGLTETSFFKGLNVFETIFEDLGDVDLIPLWISSQVLEKIIEWCQYHKHDLPSKSDENDEENVGASADVSAWNVAFFRVDNTVLFEIIQAAKYLDIKGLLDVTCKTVANMIKGKTPEEIRRIFNIQNDLTPEEEERIRKEKCED